VQGTKVSPPHKARGKHLALLYHPHHTFFPETTDLLSCPSKQSRVGNPEQTTDTSHTSTTVQQREFTALRMKKLPCREEDILKVAQNPP